MNALLVCVCLFACGWLSWFGTKKYLMIALERRLVDIPNHRSSHSVPTPRGGGIVFAFVFLAGVTSLVALHLIKPLEAITLFTGALVALMGFWDDCAGLPILGRLAIQILVSVVAVSCALSTWWAQGWKHPALPLIAIGLVFSFVWLINLTNFMDGIDGIATTEIICVASLSCLIVATHHNFDTVALAFALLAVSTCGFLFWNWPPASVFMGDAGSCFLGYSLGALTLIAVARGQLTIAVPLILLSVFIIDATLTLVKRFLRGERWYLPHCTHAFQHAAKRFGHLKTTSAVAMINLLWLGPLAVWADVQPSRGWILVGVAWLPLIALAQTLRAGEAPEMPDDSEAVLRLFTHSEGIEGLLQRVSRGVRRSKSWISARFVNGIKIVMIIVVSWLSLYLGLLSQYSHAVASHFVFTKILIVWAFVQSTILVLFRVYRSHWRLVSMEEVPTIAGMTLVSTLTGALFAFAFSAQPFGESQQRLILLVCLFSIVLMIALQMLTSLLADMRRLRIDPRKIRRVIIFGADQEGADILSSLRHLCSGCIPLGFIDARSQLKGSYICGLPVLGDASDILSTVEIYGVHEVLVPHSHFATREALALVQLCRLSGISCSIVHSVGEEMAVSAPTAPNHSTVALAVNFPLTDRVQESIANELSLEHR
jgi:Fuc2NAc and GlcNAc transferase